MAQEIKYKEEYKELLIESAKKGESIQRFCANIGISTRSFYKWVKNIEGWAEVADIAMTIRQADFLDEAKENVWTFRANHFIAGLLAHHLGLSAEKKADSEDEMDDDKKKINKIIANTLDSVADIFREEESG
jgi:hypothetical protein